jgi:hypothetical protein
MLALMKAFPCYELGTLALSLKLVKYKGVNPFEREGMVLKPGDRQKWSVIKLERAGVVVVCCDTVLARLFIPVSPW